MSIVTVPKMIRGGQSRAARPRKLPHVRGALESKEDYEAGDHEKSVHAKIADGNKGDPRECIAVSNEGDPSQAGVQKKK